MKNLLITLAAFAATGLAQDAVPGFDAVLAPRKTSMLEAGKTFEIKWEPAPTEFDDEEIEILLMAGKTPQLLNVVGKPIAEGIPNSEGGFEWKIPSSLGKEKTYGLIIRLASDPETFQYSEPFSIAAVEGGSDDGSDGDDEEDDQDEDEEESTTSSTSSVAKSTTTTFATPTPEPTKATETPLSTSSVPGAGAGARPTAAAVALLGGIAFAALGL